MSHLVGAISIEDLVLVAQNARAGTTQRASSGSMPLVASNGGGNASAACPGSATGVDPRSARGKPNGASARQTRAWFILLAFHPCPTEGRGKESPPASHKHNSHSVPHIAAVRPISVSRVPWNGSPHKDSASFKYPSV